MAQRPVRESSVEEAHAALKRFLEGAKRPVAIEPGEPEIPLEKSSFVIELEQGRLTLQAWTRDRNLVRRIVGIHAEKPGQLSLITEKFAKRQGTLELVDLERPRSETALRKATRMTSREQFRRSLLRQFPGWDLVELSSEADLQRSLSPAYPRAFLRKGARGWAAISAPSDAIDCDGVLSFGLVWLDHLRQREPQSEVAGLTVFAPEGRERTTCWRMRYLNTAATQFIAFAVGEGSEQRIDLSDYGNLDTKLQVRRADHLLEHAAASGLRDIEGVQAVESGDGAISWRMRGLEFARSSGGVLRYGLETKRVAGGSNVAEMEAVARELGRMRNDAARDQLNPLFQKGPELWLESQVRANVRELDASLEPSPIYGQVPAFTGGERGVIDLLAVDLRGRLAVLEIKASEDVHLPLQALDYWMRVRWHAAHGEFTQHGYFPGAPLSLKPPRLLLVAPSLEFHPSTEVILKYLSPEIEVERIGVGMNWRKELKVMFRMRTGEEAHS